MSAMEHKDTRLTIRLGTDIKSRLDADLSRYEAENPNIFGRKLGLADVVRLAVLDYLQRREKSGGKGRHGAG